MTMTMKLSELNSIAAEIRAIDANRVAIPDSPDPHTVTFNTTPTGLTVSLPAAAIRKLLDAVYDSRFSQLQQIGVTLD